MSFFACGMSSGSAARGRAFVPPVGAAFDYVASDADCFQDADGLIPAGEDDPVGRWLDRSGRGRHLIFGADKPTLRLVGDQWAVEWSADSTAPLAVTFAGQLPLTIACAGPEGVAVPIYGYRERTGTAAVPDVVQVCRLVGYTRNLSDGQAALLDAYAQGA